MTDRNSELTLRVAWWTQGFLAITALGFGAGAVSSLASVFEGSAGSLVLFIVLVAIACVCVANALSTIRITDESVTVSVFYGRFRICWAEVEKVMARWPFIALVGHDKRVVLSLAFAGKNADKMLEMFNQQIRSRGIVFEEGVEFPLTHHNANV